MTITTPTVLYHKTSKGDIQTWKVWTDGAAIHTEYGLLNGKKQRSHKFAEGKNVGRSNETSATQQAILEMESMIRKKSDKNYHATIEDAEKYEPMLPMLAKDYFKHHKKLPENVFVQPKYDGVRCIAYWDGTNVTLFSRGNKTYDIPHITKEMADIFKKYEFQNGMAFDGELYNHEMTFSEISSAVKKTTSATDRIAFVIYDFVSDYLPFKERNKILIDIQEYIHNTYDNIVISEGVEVGHSKKTMESCHDAFILGGFEGLIIRSPDLPYKLGYRSDQLLKYKVFQDEEFVVIDVSAGVGKFADMAIFTCENNDGSGTEFNVVPKGTEQERRDYLTYMESYIGKKLTVKFFGRTDDGIPRFPVGKGFKIEKDQG